MAGSKLDTRSRIRIEGVVQRLDLRLDGRVSVRRRRQIRRELRANLAEAAADKGTDEAVRQLGDLRQLAGAYLETEAGTVDWRKGCWAAAATFVILHVMAIVLFIAYGDGFEAAGGQGSWSYSYDLFFKGFGPFSASKGSGLMFEFSFLTPAHLVLMGTAYILGSRAWRSVTRTDTARA